MKFYNIFFHEFSIKNIKFQIFGFFPVYTQQFNIILNDKNNITPQINDSDLLQFALAFMKIQERETNPDKGLECINTRFEIK